jgi:hypothetical protein
MQKSRSVPDLLRELEDFATAVSTTLSPSTINWLWRPSPDEWSLTEVCCHLRDVEREIHQPRLRTMIAQENAFIPGATPDEWAKERNYRAENGRDALHAFRQYRRETLDLLTNLDEALWQRQARHAFFGPTTLQEIANLIVSHDRAHWEQIGSLVVG